MDHLVVRHHLAEVVEVVEEAVVVGMQTLEIQGAHHGELRPDSL